MPQHQSLRLLILGLAVTTLLAACGKEAGVAGGTKEREDAAAFERGKAVATVAAAAGGVPEREIEAIAAAAAGLALASHTTTSRAAQSHPVSSGDALDRAAAEGAAAGRAFAAMNHFSAVVEKAAAAHPDGTTGARLRSGALAAADAAAWELSSKTVRSLLAYVAGARTTEYAEKATTMILSLRANEDLFAQAVSAGSPSSLQNLLSEYPGHAREADALGLLARAMPAGMLTDPRMARHVDIEIVGGGIASTTVRLTKKGDGAVFVVIPVGSLFRSSNETVQTMLSTRAVATELDQWQKIIEVPVTCTNLRRHIPTTDDRLSLESLAADHLLARVARALELAGAPFTVRQAAVWIITDDADFGALGILVSGGTQPDRRDARRDIKEQDAARALKLLHDAGISTRGRSIWRDRSRIAAQLTDSRLKDWLLTVAPQ